MVAAMGDKGSGQKASRGRLTSYLVQLMVFMWFTAAVPLLWLAILKLFPQFKSIISISPQWGTYGTWLQGSLTPIVLVFTILAFLRQSRDTREQIDEQREANAEQRKANAALTNANEMLAQQVDKLSEANKLTAQMLFLDTLDSYTDHLDYLCYAAANNSPVDPKGIRTKDTRAGIYDMISILTGKVPARNALSNVLARDPHLICRTPYYGQLQQEAESLIQRGKDLGLEGRIEFAVINLVIAMREKPYN